MATTEAAASTFSLALGSGLGTTVQLVPSQFSMTVEVIPVLGSLKDPTAQMLLAETAATPLS